MKNSMNNSDESKILILIKRDTLLKKMSILNQSKNLL